MISNAGFFRESSFFDNTAIAASLSCACVKAKENIKRAATANFSFKVKYLVNANYRNLSTSKIMKETAKKGL